MGLSQLLHDLDTVTLGRVLIATGLFLILSNTMRLFNEKRKQRDMERVFENKREMR